MYPVQVKYVRDGWEKCVQQKSGWCLWLLWPMLRYYRAEHSTSPRAGRTVPGRPMFHQLNAEWGNRYDVHIHPWKPEFQPFLTISAEGLTPSHFETPSFLRSTSCFTAFWKSICRPLWSWRWRNKQWALRMQWILEVRRKVAVGCAYWIFAVYLRAQFIEGGFHMPYCFPYSFYYNPILEKLQ